MKFRESCRTSSVLFRKEMGSYVQSPILYIIMTIFLVILGVLYFRDFYMVGRADMRNMFGLLPFLFMFIVPAITMKQFAEERSSGTLEMLITMPVTTGVAVAGKFFASLIVMLIMLAPTLLYVLSLGMAGQPDYGMILGGYIGTVFLAALYVSIGIFASSLTKNQVVAWLISFAICAVVTLIYYVLQFLPGWFFSLLSYLGSGYHYENVTKGVLDFRDLSYFTTGSLLFLLLAAKTIDNRR